MSSESSQHSEAGAARPRCTHDTWRRWKTHVCFSLFGFRVAPSRAPRPQTHLHDLCSQALEARDLNWGLSAQRCVIHIRAPRRARGRSGEKRKPLPACSVPASWWWKMNIGRSPAGRGAARQEGRRRVRLQREGRTRRGDGEMGGGREKRTRFCHRRRRYAEGPSAELTLSSVFAVDLTGPNGFWQLFQAGLELLKAVTAGSQGALGRGKQCGVLTWCLPRLKTHLLSDRCQPLCNNQTHINYMWLNLSSCESDYDSSQRL